MTSVQAKPGSPQPLTAMSSDGKPLRSRVVGGLLLVLFSAALYLPAYVYEGDRYWLPLFSKFMALRSSP